MFILRFSAYLYSITQYPLYLRAVNEGVKLSPGSIEIPEKSGSMAYFP